jgi:hypothetical protein
MCILGRPAARFMPYLAPNHRHFCRLAHGIVQFVAIPWSGLGGFNKVRTSTNATPNANHQPNPKENTMNTNTINKDNAGSTVLLAAMILTIASALFISVTAEAKANNVLAAAVTSKTVAAAPATSNKTTTDTLVITATRLK